MKREFLKYAILNLGIYPSKISNFEQKIDLLIETYYSREVNFNTYLKSKNKLIQLIIEGDFPTAEEWDKIAKKEMYLSHLSLKYISGCNWKKFKKVLILEIKDIFLN